MIRKLLANALYAHARWWLSLGRLGWGHAGRLLRYTCDLWPRHPEAPSWLKYVQGKEALQRGQPERALALLLDAERVLPSSLGLRADIGLAQTLAGNWEQAIVVLERAVKEEPGVRREDAWSSLAWAYMKTGRAPKAREACMRAETVDVLSPRLQLIHRLATGVGLGSLPVSELTELLDRLPDAGVLVLEFARQQAGEGRRRLARAAVSAFPADEQARVLAVIARASLNEDDPATAAWAADEVAALNAADLAAETAIVRSEVALREGRDEVALTQARAAIAAHQAPGPAHEQTGRVLLLSGDWDGAVDAMIEALHTGRAGPLAAGVAALAALEVGDRESARGVFLGARCGDGLACACSHTAQSRLLAAEGELVEALHLAAWALDEIGELPQWARRPVVMQRLCQALREVVRGARDASGGEDRETTTQLLQQLDATVAGLPPAD